MRGKLCSNSVLDGGERVDPSGPGSGVVSPVVRLPDRFASKIRKTQVMADRLEDWALQYGLHINAAEILSSTSASAGRRMA